MPASPKPRAPTQYEYHMSPAAPALMKPNHGRISAYATSWGTTGATPATTLPTSGPTEIAAAIAPSPSTIAIVLETFSTPS
jgi:hypothetical protein